MVCFFKSKFEPFFYTSSVRIECTEMVFAVFFLYFTGFFLLSFDVFHKILLIFVELDWVLLGFTVLNWILPGFRVFNRILPSFIQFY